VKFSVVEQVAKLFVTVLLLKPVAELFLEKALIEALQGLLALLMIAYFMPKLISRKFDRVFWAIVLAISFLLLVAILDLILLDNVPSQLVVVNLLQMTTPMVFALFLATLNPASLLAVARFSVGALLVVAVVGLIEQLLPIDLRVSILNAIRGGTGQRLPLDYELTIFNSSFTRSGSILFLPLTYGYLAFFLVTLSISAPFRDRRGTQLVAIVALITSFVRSVFMTSVVALALIPFRRVWRILGVIVLFSIIFLGSVFYLPNLKSLSTVRSNENLHLSGLLYGVASAFDNFGFGNGIGSAGFLSFQYVLEHPDSVSPFRDSYAPMNGNESAVGVLIHELGLVGSVIFFLPYMAVVFQVKSKRRWIGTVVVGFLVSLFFSESGLSLTVMSFFWLWVLVARALSDSGLRVDGAETIGEEKQ